MLLRRLSKSTSKISKIFDDPSSSIALLRDSPYKNPLSGRNLASLIQSFIYSEGFYQPCLRQIHAQVFTSGHHVDTFLCNLLLSGYSKSGCLQHAQKLFDVMPQRNMVSWSTLLSMYAKRGRPSEALAVFSSFRRVSSLSPQEHILGSVLRACAQLAVEEFGVGIHGLVVKLGFEFDVVVGTALVNLYSKAGDMVAAAAVFCVLPEKNSVTWTTIISGFVQSGQSSTALELFRQMIVSGAQPDDFVLSSALSACSVVGLLGGGRQLHGFIVRFGAGLDPSVANVLIDLYCKCGRAGTAWKVFDRMPERNLVSWTTMIAGYMQNQLDEEALGLFWEMGCAGLSPDAFALTSALTSCGSLMARRLGEQAHARAVKCGLHRDGFVKNGLVDMYAKCGAMGEARQSFEAILEKNFVSFNAMIEGLASAGDLGSAAELFMRMMKEEVWPTPLTFVSILSAAGQQADLQFCRQVHCLCVKHGVAEDLFSGSALISAYWKCASAGDARAVFNSMVEKDIVVWNAMAAGYAQKEGEEEEALRLFKELKRAGKPVPGGFTFVAVLAGAGELAGPAHVAQLHGQVLQGGFHAQSHVCNALLDGYGKCGAMGDARKLFEGMKERDVVCWNSMICNCARHGLAEEATALFRRMLEEGKKPSYVTFVGVLSACGHAGKVEEGLAWFGAMREEFGLEPGTEHYASVVGMLGRAGRAEEAREVAEGMVGGAPGVVWRALLAACQRAGDVELGKYAAERCVRGDSGSYVLLSNILASNDLWVDVEKVREGMELQGVPKKPGYSMVLQA
ncbi:pentatricopeptide repeat-containing protein At4g39530-like [Wolffia australiana]